MRSSIILLLALIIGLLLAGGFRSCAEMTTTENGVTILRSGVEQ